MLKHKQCSGKRLGKMYAYANFSQLSPKAGLGTGTILQAKIDKSVHNSPRHEMIRILKE